MGNSLIQRFNLPSGKVRIIRKNAAETNADYMVLLGYQNYGWGIRMGTINGVPGAAAPEMDNYDLLIWRGAQSHNLGTKTGSWSNSAGGYFGGSAGVSSVAGSTIQWTTGANCDKIGIMDVTGVNYFVCKVELNGDPTLANLLPTAQTLVTN